MAYSQDAVLGHAFAAVYEWVIEGARYPGGSGFRKHLSSSAAHSRTLRATGRGDRATFVKDVAEQGRDCRQRRHVALSRRVEISAAGVTISISGPSRTWSAATTNALLELNNEQLDEVGNTEMLPWMILFGAIGQQPGELITYQPTWHHGHAVMRFIPNKRKGTPTTPRTRPKYNFGTPGGYQFYRHPNPSVVSAE